MTGNPLYQRYERPSMESIMILGAGRGQIGLYEACARMGIRTIAASIEGKYPALELADERCIVDISDPCNVLRSSTSYELVGVATSCMDTGVEAQGLLNSEYSLSGVSYDSAKLCFDKEALYGLLDRAGVPIPKTVVLRTEQDAIEAWDRLGDTLVLKQSRSQGSKGVCIARSIEDVTEYFRILSESGQTVIAQEYADGVEFGAQALVQNGEVRLFLIHGDLMDASNSVLPRGHFYPCLLNSDVKNEAARVGVMAIKACKFDNCAVNIDFKLNKGLVSVLELTARAGANGLPEMVGKVIGRNYYEEIVKLAVGEGIRSCRIDGSVAAIIMMLGKDDPLEQVMEKAERIGGIELRFYNVCDQYANQGQGPMGNSVGYALATANTLKESLC